MGSTQSSMDGTRSSPRAGLREAHAHLLALGQAMQRLDLSSCVDVDDCLSRVSNAASEVRVIHNFGDRPGRADDGSGAHDVSGNDASRPRAIDSTRPWIIATGLRPHAWKESRWPTMRELDGVCSDIPCFLTGFDHHSAACNSLAFAHFGYHATTPDPVGGTIVRGEDAQPTGVLLEGAYTRARELIPQPSRDETVVLVEQACRKVAAMGYVQVHDLLAQPFLGEVLAELDDLGRLPLRVGLFAPMDLSEDFRAFDEFARSSRRWARERVQFLGGKVFADGTLNNATAAMLESYREPIPGHPRGQLLLDDAQLARAMEHVAGCGATLETMSGRPTLAVHAIGDRAVRAVLDAYDMVSASPQSRPALRIEHAELIDEADVQRFQLLGVTASVQPCHLLYDVEVLRRQLPHRLSRVLPLRELIDSGLVPGETLIFGSDAPIVRAEPEDSIRAAVHRRRAGVSPGDAISPAQAISEEEAWACFSTCLARET